MAPMAPSLARSESKAKFLTRIGLNENDKSHRHLYSKMKAEAVEGWSRMTSTRDALTPVLRNDPAVEPPYTYAQINETAMRAEVLRIYDQASPQTRIMYNLANDDDMPMDENWIIRWLLWHVFRYRDDRNGAVNRCRVPPAHDTPSPNQQESPAPIIPATHLSSSTPLAISPSADRGSVRHVGETPYWDPVREQWRGK